LGEETHANSNEHTSDIGSSGKKLLPWLLRGLLFGTDCNTDLLVFGIDELRVFVPLCMVFYENGACLLVSLFGNQEPGRLWNKPGLIASVLSCQIMPRLRLELTR